VCIAKRRDTVSSLLPSFYPLTRHPLYIRPELGNLQSQGNTLLALHAIPGFFQLQVSLEFMVVLFQVHDPCLFGLIIGHVDIYAALCDIGVD
jgi:hypothetical protein